MCLREAYSTVQRFRRLVFTASLVRCVVTSVEYRSFFIMINEFVLSIGTVTKSFCLLSLFKNELMVFVIKFVIELDFLMSLNAILSR